MRELYHQINDPEFYKDVDDVVGKIRDFCKNYEVQISSGKVPKGINNAEAAEGNTEESSRSDRVNDGYETWLNALVPRWLQ